MNKSILLLLSVMMFTACGKNENNGGQSFDPSSLTKTEIIKNTTVELEESASFLDIPEGENEVFLKIKGTGRYIPHYKTSQNRYNLGDKKPGGEIWIIDIICQVVIKDLIGIVFDNNPQTPLINDFAFSFEDEVIKANLIKEDPLIVSLHFSASEKTRRLKIRNQTISMTKKQYFNDQDCRARGYPQNGLIIAGLPSLDDGHSLDLTLNTYDIELLKEVP